MSEGPWSDLLEAFVGRQIEAAEFHDRFFDLWHDAMKREADIPAAISTLFYVVEAFCPDERLRVPDSPYEADEPELRQAADTALRRLASNTVRTLS